MSGHAFQIFPHLAAFSRASGSHSPTIARASGQPNHYHIYSYMGRKEKIPFLRKRYLFEFSTVGRERNLFGILIPDVVKYFGRTDSYTGNIISLALFRYEGALNLRQNKGRQILTEFWLPPNSLTGNNIYRISATKGGAENRGFQESRRVQIPNNGQLANNFFLDRERSTIPTLEGVTDKPSLEC